MKAHSEKSMNVSDVSVTDEDDFSVPLQNDQSKQQDCERTNLGYTSEDAIDERVASIENRVCEPVQGVQDFTCDFPRTQHSSRRHRIRSKHKKLTLGGLITADCVGREIWTRPR